MGTSMTAAQSLLLACSLVAAVACDESITGPSARLEREFTLAPGEAARIEDTNIGVRFTGVRDDSRCPVDVNCIQAGTAVVRITVVDASTQRDYELRTDGRSSVRHDDLTIALVSLAPQPRSSRVIESRDYRATLRVTR